MSRTGSTIRSAKMNAITPPKLIPPFHSTAASGTFPTEQTKDAIATTIGPQNLAKTGWELRKNPFQEILRYPNGERTGKEETTRDVLPDRHPIHDEVVVDGRSSLQAENALDDRTASDGHVHLRVPLHASANTFTSLSPCLIDHLAGQEGPKEHHQNDDHDWRADEL